MKNHPLRLAVLAASLLSTIHQAPALQIEGVDIPPQVTVSGKMLQLNGAGLRTVVLLVVPIKAYVASFYAPAPLRSAKAVMASPGPLQLNFTFLQGVGQSQVTDAWTAQFKDSVTFTYPGFETDRDKFIRMFGPLKKGGVETVVIDGDDTRVYDGGTLKGTIAGRNFQKAFLSLWFGSNPVMPELKSALLGK
jgi:hypothetical protein